MGRHAKPKTPWRAWTAAAAGGVLVLTLGGIAAATAANMGAENVTASPESQAATPSATPTPVSREDAARVAQREMLRTQLADRLTDSETLEAAVLDFVGATELDQLRAARDNARAVRSDDTDALAAAQQQLVEGIRTVALAAVATAENARAASPYASDGWIEGLAIAIQQTQDALASTGAVSDAVSNVVFHARGVEQSHADNIPAPAPRPRNVGGGAPPAPPQPEPSPAPPPPADPEPTPEPEPTPPETTATPAPQVTAPALPEKP